MQQSPNANSIFKQGHHQHQDGRDIIPPFKYQENGKWKWFDGLNWDDEGRAIYDAGCEVPKDPDPKDPPKHTHPKMIIDTPECLLDTNTLPTEFTVKVADVPKKGGVKLIVSKGDWSKQIEVSKSGAYDLPLKGAGLYTVKLVKKHKVVDVQNFKLKPCKEQPPVDPPADPPAMTIAVPECTIVDGVSTLPESLSVTVSGVTDGMYVKVAVSKGSIWSQAVRAEADGVYTLPLAGEGTYTVELRNHGKTVQSETIVIEPCLDGSNDPLPPEMTFTPPTCLPDGGGLPETFDVLVTGVSVGMTVQLLVTAGDGSTETIDVPTGDIVTVALHGASDYVVELLESGDVVATQEFTLDDCAKPEETPPHRHPRPADLPGTRYRRCHGCCGNRRQRG